MAQYTSENVIRQLDPPTGLAPDNYRLQTWLNELYELVGEKREWFGGNDADVALGTSDTTIVSITIGDTIRAGDKYLILASYIAQKVSTTGDIRMQIDAALSGTGTGRWNAFGNYSGENPYDLEHSVAASGYHQGTCAGVFSIDTVDPSALGTMNVLLKGNHSGGSTNALADRCVVYVWLLHRGKGG